MTVTEHDSDGVDAVRGALLLLVMLGHDMFITVPFPRFFPVVNNVHVIGFLLLPFMFPSRPLTLRFVAERAVRYLVPYAVFAVLCAILYRAMYGSEQTIAAWFGSVVVAILHGGAATLKEATGFSLFWFLPALFSVALLRSLWISVSRTWRMVLGVLLVGGHVTMGTWPDWLRLGLPMSFSIAIFVVPLGWAVAWLYSRGSSHPSLLAIGSALTAATCGVIAFIMNSSSNIGGVSVWAWNHPSRLLLHDVLAAGFFLAVFSGRRWLAAVAFLRRLGHDSLSIYLTHALFLQVYLAIMIKLRLGPGHAVPLNILGSVAFMTAGALLAAIALRWPPLRHWVMPRSSADWALLMSRVEGADSH